MDTEIKLTESQNNALNKIRKWFSNHERINNPDKQIFKLYGSAGTGKSFLINYIVNLILEPEISTENIAFVTPTGKAASVLMQRFPYENISTIHKLIYHVEIVKVPVAYDDDGKVIKTIEEVKYHRKSDLDNIKLIVIDEFSMVDSEILEDIKRYNLPIIALGDPYQLPPINGQKINANECDAILTEIVRQHNDNQIIKIANDIKNGEKLKYGNFNNQVVVLSKRTLSESEYINILLSSDQIICGLNRTRDKINKLIRKYKNFKTEYPEEGDKLICKLNNYSISFDKYTLANGIIGTCTYYKQLNNHLCKLDFKPDFVNEDIENIISDNGIFENNEYYYPLRQSIYELGLNNYEPKKNLTKEMKKQNPKKYKEESVQELLNKLSAISILSLNRFEYAYAISCHASQGSEFNNVVVIDESFAFKESQKERLYTAITRAKEKVIIIH